MHANAFCFEIATIDQSDVGQVQLRKVLFIKVLPTMKKALRSVR